MFKTKKIAGIHTHIETMEFFKTRSLDTGPLDRQGVVAYLSSDNKNFPDEPGATDLHIVA